MKLTERQKETIEFIRGFILAHNYSPTFREIMDGLKIHSTSTVYERLKKLRETGKVDWIDGSPRTIRIIENKQQELNERIRIQVVLRVIEKDKDGNLVKFVMGGKRYVLDSKG